MVPFLENSGKLFINLLRQADHSFEVREHRDGLRLSYDVRSFQFLFDLIQKFKQISVILLLCGD